MPLVATTWPALTRVIETLHLGTTPAELGKRVFAEARSDSTLMTVTAQDTDPARAAAIANALADDLIASSPATQGRGSEFQQSIDDDLKATQDQITATQDRVDTLAALTRPEPEDLATLESLQGRLASLRSTYASLLAYSTGSAGNLLSIVEPALAPDAAVQPRTLLNTMLGSLVALFLALALAAILEYLDDRVKNADTIQETAGLSTLGTVARMETDAGRAEFYQLATLLFPRSAVAESYRTLRSNIEFGSVDSPARTLLVTSAAPDDGKTITASNLAVAFAQAGRPTILVDADLRKPGVHLVFQASIESGLTTLLRDDGMSVDQVAQVTEQPNLRIVTTGPLPPNPAELLGSNRDGCGRGPAHGRSRPGDLRRSASAGRRGRAGDEFLPGCHPPGRECRANPARRPAPSAGCPGPRRRQRAGRRAQPRPEVVRLELLRLRLLRQQAGRSPPEATAVSPTSAPEAAPAGAPYRQASTAGDRPARRAAPKQS